MLVEIKISGLGGQGVVLASIILGHAGVMDGKYVAQTMSYGAEARGTAAWGDVVISDEPIAYPMTVKCDILVAMSQSALDKYIGVLKEGGALIIDSDLVTEMPPSNYMVYKIPATKLAEKIGRKIFANMIMLGFLSGITGVVSAQSLKKAVLENVPRAKENNVKAVKLGLEKAGEYKHVR